MTSTARLAFRALALLLALPSPLCAAANHGSAPGFEAHGTLLWKAPDEQTPKVTSWRFMARVALPDWQLRIEPTDPLQAQTFIDLSRELLCDGEDIYALNTRNPEYENDRQTALLLARFREIERRLLQERPNDPELANVRRQISMLDRSLTYRPPADLPRAAATGIVRAGVMPPMGTDHALGLLWFAFCGSKAWTALPSGTMPAPPPVFGMSETASPTDACYVDAWWTVVDDPFRSLSRLHIFAKAKVYRGPLLRPLEPIALEPMSIAPGGLQTHDYRVELFTHSHGWQIPARFVWERGNIGSDRYVGEVTNTLVLPSDWTCRPWLSALTSVTDYRFWKSLGRHVGFVAEPGPWPGREEVSQTAGFKRVESSAKNARTAQGSPIITWLMRSLVAIALLMGPVAALRRRRRHGASLQTGS
ncbi:MAG: hypothetical protein H7A45_13350 [Verrucomicrobiales bacterium]|nr:hypothetical protein [Verrucomicrobiales bacterium]MCP5528322.1 hypothetical protein [Verrucomicrobiales bacterium]